MIVREKAETLAENPFQNNFTRHISDTVCWRSIPVFRGAKPVTYKQAIN